ncbi:MAG TPA: Omp28-related outer membrane protein [Bacteroidales bacterium]|nr:Omp28-related outer membrane protein [Bacteroidales bacterium]HRZ76199.1 Omp28-related outer membrane protein [Bacteroidales bacterium]
MIRLPLFLLTALVLATACDKIEEPYLRDGSKPVDTSACPVPAFPALPAPVQKVLLEDYTGHTCVNCPGAAVLAHELQGEYPGRLIVMAIHAGWFAQPGSAPYATDYRTVTGSAWDDFFGVGALGNPNGMINRAGYPTNHVLGPANWAAKVALEMTRTPILTLQLITEYDEAERKLCSHARTTFLQDLNLDLSIGFYLVEDSIVSAQKNNDPGVGPTPDILDYTHKHMLRDAINGTWGSSLASADTTTTAGHQIVTSYPYTLPAQFNAEHCKVIVFIYRTDTWEIVQVEEVEAVSKD